MTRAIQNSVRSLASFGVFFLLAAAPALAEESKPSLADAPIGQVFKWINFAIVLGLLIYAFRKALPYFRTHAEEISQKIAEGTRARESAEKRRGEAQAKLANIGTDVAEMRLEAKRAAALEAERVRGLARTEADTIERAAQAEIAATERAARVGLKTLAARMAIERAEALLRQELKPKVEMARFLELVLTLAVLVGPQPKAGTERTSMEMEGSTN
jgi:F0F1-type ATP synthase membrane subunit b/b'